MWLRIKRKLRLLSFRVNNTDYNRNHSFERGMIMNTVKIKEVNSLKDLREHAGVTQERIAKVLRIDQATYSRWERSHGRYVVRNLKLSQAIDLANFYGLDSLDDLEPLTYGCYNSYLKTKFKKREA